MVNSPGNAGTLVSGLDAGHPALLAASDFKKALTKMEQRLFAEALDLLTSSRRLLKLIRGKDLAQELARHRTR